MGTRMHKEKMKLHICYHIVVELDFCAKIGTSRIFKIVK